MWMRFFSKIPLINSISYFSWKCHKVAIPKFLVLWGLSSAPIILSVSLSQIPEGSGNILTKFMQKLGEGLTVSELFVYSASFLTPLIYIIFERYAKMEAEESFAKKITEAMKVFRGYQILWFISAFFLLMTAIGFSSVKTGGDTFNNTFLYFFLVDGAYFIYFFALFCWYLSILDGVFLGGDFVSENRDDEAELVSDFSQRLVKRGGK